MIAITEIIADMKLKTRGEVEGRDVVGVGATVEPSRLRVHHAPLVPEAWPDWGIICVDSLDKRAAGVQLKKHGYTGEMLFAEIFETYFSPNRRPPEEYYLDECVKIEAGAVHIEPGAMIGIKSPDAVWMGDWFIEYPHIASVKIGAFAWIGAGVIIERGQMQDTVIGQSVRIGAGSIIRSGAVIGANNILPAGTIIAAGAIIPKEER